MTIAIPLKAAERRTALWHRRDLFATTLVVLFIDEFAEHQREVEDDEHNPLYWNPATIEMEIRDEHGVELPGRVLDRLLTGISLITSNNFQTSEDDFLKDCLALSGRFVTRTAFALPSAADVCWGVVEAQLLCQSKFEPSPAIVELIAQILHREGILTPPANLKHILRMTDLQSQVNADWADDPSMYESIWTRENERTSAIDQLMTSRLHGLFAQLESLPLQNGSASMLKALLARIPAASAAALDDE